MASNPVEDKWQATRARLLAELDGKPVIGCQIPNWEPVDLQTGLRWLQASIYEGFSVAYRLERSNEGVSIWLKNWEFEEPEPEWN